MHYPVSSKSTWNGSIAILKESNSKQLVLQSKQHSSACSDDLYILSLREFSSRSKTSAVSLTWKNQRRQGPKACKEIHKHCCSLECFLTVQIWKHHPCLVFVPSPPFSSFIMRLFPACCQSHICLFCCCIIFFCY